MVLVGGVCRDCTVGHAIHAVCHSVRAWAVAMERVADAVGGVPS